MVIMGCNAPPNSSLPESSPLSSSPVASPSISQSPVASSAPSEPKAPSVPVAQTISAQGIGAAKLGVSFGELKQALGANTEFTIQSPFIVDFDALAVTQAGKVQYYILYPAGTTLADSDLIKALLTNNPNYRTAEGIGPRTPIKKAEETYGDATLSYNTSNESREYIKFSNQPAQNIYFHHSIDQGFAGTYSSPSQEYNETKKFRNNALIDSVEVLCLSQNCREP